LKAGWWVQRNRLPRAFAGVALKIHATLAFKAPDPHQFPPAPNTFLSPKVMPI